MKKLAIVLGALVASLGMLLAGTAPAQAAASITNDFGYDIAWPQCDNPLPSQRGAFTIIDVDGGRPYTQNPCLASQLRWATAAGSKIQLYVNTANPGGPNLIRHFQGSKRTTTYDYSESWPCADNPSTSVIEGDTISCAYAFGYRAAANSYANAAAKFREAGITYSPKSVNWWLDLEVARFWGQEANTWRGIDPEFSHPNDKNLSNADKRARNIAALRGELDYLVDKVKVKQVGFYGAPYEWQTLLTQNSNLVYDRATFADHPFWYPIGVSTIEDARQTCNTKTDVTGSAKPVMVQFKTSEYGLDQNVLCRPSTKTTYRGDPSVKAATSFFLRAKVISTSSGIGLHGQTVRFTYRGHTYTARTNSRGFASVLVKAPSARGRKLVTVSYSTNSYRASSTSSYISFT